MKCLKISVVSAAILAAASFGAQAQQPQPGTESAPGMNKEKVKPESGQKVQPEHSAKPDEGRGGQAQAPAGGDRAGAGEKPKQGAEKPGDMNKTGKPDDSMNKGAAQGQKQDGDRKSADQKQDGDHKAADQKPAGDNKAADQKPAGDNKAADQKPGGDNRAADQKPGGDNKTADQKPGGDNKTADQGQGGGKQASKEIKPEQKTVIKETIVKEHIRPEKINVQVRVGVAIPRTVVLHPLPPTIIEIYPTYSRYKLVMVDENTILVIDPDTWMIVDVIEV